MNSENSKTSDTSKLVLNLADKINIVQYQTLISTIHGKI